MLHEEAAEKLKRFENMTFSILPTINTDNISIIGKSIVSNETMECSGEEKNKLAMTKFHGQWILISNVKTDTKNLTAYCSLSKIYFLEENMVPEFIRSRFSSLYH